MPWPGIDPLTLHGEMTDVLGHSLPPGRLLAYSAYGQQFGDGGVTLIDYTLTLASGWHEQDPRFTITYYNYKDLVEYYCTVIDLRTLAYRPVSDYTVYADIQCAFNWNKPMTNWPVISQPRQQGDIWVV